MALQEDSAIPLSVGGGAILAALGTLLFLSKASKPNPYEAIDRILNHQLAPKKRWFEDYPQRVNAFADESWSQQTLFDVESLEDEELPDAETLLRLVDQEKSKNPNFRMKQINFPPGERAVLIYEGGKTRAWGQDEADWLWMEQSDGTWERKTPREVFDRIQCCEDPVDYLEDDPNEKFNKEFWESPGEVFHGTDALDLILKEGIEARSQTRGPSNRDEGNAVFASFSPEYAEQYAHGMNGGVVQIDTPEMKVDKYTPFTTKEPGITQYEALEAIAYRLGLPDIRLDSESDIDPDTVILHGDIPAKYVSALNALNALNEYLAFGR